MVLERWDEIASTGRAFGAPFMDNAGE